MRLLRPGTLLMVSWGARDEDGNLKLAKREFIIVGRIFMDESGEERFDGFSSLEGRRVGWTEIVYSSVKTPPPNPELGWKVLVW